MLYYNKNVMIKNKSFNEVFRNKIKIKAKAKVMSWL